MFLYGLWQIPLTPKNPNSPLVFLFFKTNIQVTGIDASNKRRSAHGAFAMLRKPI
tara:strand:- start:580 stop:744 length:165 start_codon:yes stop_codon:yes gene_type:complete